MFNMELTHQTTNGTSIVSKRNVQTSDPAKETVTKEMTGKMLARWPRTVALIAGDAGRLVIEKARSTDRQSRRAKDFDPVELIPLGHAVLCEDCQMISRARNDHCLSCGSHSILSLVTVLGSQSTATF
jgi:hypothetical protein